jgi:hypothetical protein
VRSSASVPLKRERERERAFELGAARERCNKCDV